MDHPNLAQDDRRGSGSGNRPCLQKQCEFYRGLDETRWVKGGLQLALIYTYIYTYVYYYILYIINID